MNGEQNTPSWRRRVLFLSCVACLLLLLPCPYPSSQVPIPSLVVWHFQSRLLRNRQLNDDFDCMKPIRRVQEQLALADSMDWSSKSIFNRFGTNPRGKGVHSQDQRTARDSRLRHQTDIPDYFQFSLLLARNK